MKLIAFVNKLRVLVVRMDSLKRGNFLRERETQDNRVSDVRFLPTLQNWGPAL